MCLRKRIVVILLLLASPLFIISGALAKLVKVSVRPFSIALVAAICLVVFLTLSLLPSVEITQHGIVGLTVGIAQADTTRSIELIESRTERSKTYSLGNNRYSVDSYISPIHYKTDYGNVQSAWLDIDTTIGQDGILTAAPYDLQVYLTGAPGFYIASKISGTYSVRLKAARISNTDSTPVTANTKVIPTINGNTITWKNYYPDVDIILTAGNGGVTLQRLIKTDSAAKEYDVIITKVQDGELQLKPLKSATDAIGQSISMVSTITIDGRTETLKNIVTSPNAKPIVYPVLDAIDVNIGAGADDGYIFGNGNFDATSNYMYWGSNNDWVPYDGVQEWARFTGITIAQSSTIDVSYLSLWGGGVLAGDGGDSNIYAEDANNPSAPTTRDDYLGKTKTTNYVLQAYTGDGYNNTNSLNTVVQELVNSYDYSNEAMQFLMVGVKDGSNIAWLGTYERTNYQPKLHIEYTEGGGSPSLTNSPTSKDLGTNYPDGRAVYAKGTAPGNPVVVGDCTFIIISDSSITENITISGTNPTPGWTLAATTGADQCKVTAYYVGQNPASGVVLTTSAQAFYNGLAASANISWDFKLEMPTSSTNSTQRTFVIQLTAITP